MSEEHLETQNDSGATYEFEEIYQEDILNFKTKVTDEEHANITNKEVNYENDKDELNDDLENEKKRSRSRFHSR